MELSVNFTELEFNELEIIEGGNWKNVFYGVSGSVLLANSLAIGVVNVPAGISAAGTGLYLLGCIQ